MMATDIPTGLTMEVVLDRMQRASNFASNGVYLNVSAAEADTYIWAAQSMLDEARIALEGVHAADSIGDVPQSRGVVSDEDAARIRVAASELERAEAEMRRAVLSASSNGASVRELAALTGKSTNTISRWKRGE